MQIIIVNAYTWNIIPQGSSLDVCGLLGTIKWHERTDIHKNYGKHSLSRRTVHGFTRASLSHKLFVEHAGMNGCVRVCVCVIVVQVKMCTRLCHKTAHCQDFRSLELTVHHAHMHTEKEQVWGHRITAPPHLFMSAQIIHVFLRTSRRHNSVQRRSLLPTLPTHIKPELLLYFWTPVIGLHNCVRVYTVSLCVRQKVSLGKHSSHRTSDWLL